MPAQTLESAASDTIVRVSENKQRRRPRVRRRQTAGLISILPTIFLVLSFAFGLTATTSKQWSYNDMKNLDTNNAIVTTRVNRSPFINCAVTAPNSTFIENCSITPLCDPTNDVDYPTLCYLLSFTKKTMIAADVLAGVGMFFSFFVAIAVLVGRPEYVHRREYATDNSLLSYFALFTLLISLVSAITFFVTHFIATDMLVNHQQPNGNFIVNGASTNMQSPWLPGGTQKYLFMSWGFAILGIASMGIAWSLPKWYFEHDGHSFDSANDHEH